MINDFQSGCRRPAQCILGVVAVFLSACGQGPATEADIRQAVERSLPVLQASMEVWTDRSACVSCHHQALGIMAVSYAKELDFAINDEMLRDQIEWVHNLLQHGPAQNDDGEPNPQLSLPVAPLLTSSVGGVAEWTGSYFLTALAAADVAPNDVTDIWAYYLEGAQSDQGAWVTAGNRPPLEETWTSVTALTIRAIDVYAEPGRRRQADRRIEAAKNWLMTSVPESNEERTMRIFGLGWAGADAEAIDEAVRELVALQRDDGGWSQIPTLGSDAYATGQALIALNQFGGRPIDDPAFQRGLRYLLDTQLDDGSWRQETRRGNRGMRQFDTGFPGPIRTQFISFAGSAWATMALTASLGDGPSRVFHGRFPERQSEHPLLSELGFEDVHLAAVFGTAEELQALLDAGADPNAVGPQNVTPLMLAVHDPVKVDLLLARGADANAMSESDMSPMSIAASITGSEDVLERLKSAGAEISVEEQDRERMPLMLAVRRGNADNVRWLLANGEPSSDELARDAADWAGAVGAVDILELLAPYVDDFEIYYSDVPLIVRAARNNKERILRFLIDNGADIDLASTDEDGFARLTPLMAAARRDYGHTRILEMLLEAGADTTLTDVNGYTALDWAERRGNEAQAAVLRAYSGR